MSRSIEPEVELNARRLFQEHSTPFIDKNGCINEEIDRALKSALSKQGGEGGNKPDIQLMVSDSKMHNIPVMIEAKGTANKLIKIDKNGNIELITQFGSDSPAGAKSPHKKGDPNYSTIKDYAVNGAVHYAKGIINGTDSWKECIAVGINGYDDDAGRHFEQAIYFVSKNNLSIPIFLGNDLSVLFKENWGDLFRLIERAQLSESEREQAARDVEAIIEANMKKLNQTMHENLGIAAGSRVKIVAGMIMAGLGVDGKIAPLEITDLKGDNDTDSNDGRIFLDKIEAFLKKKQLPNDKIEIIMGDLKGTFLYRGLWTPVEGESKLKQLYIDIKKDIIPYIDSTKDTYLDFTGKLFNVLTDWIDIPDGEQNDVVLTPRYVTNLMAKLCEVNKDSYVWDYATGTAGFLVSSMRLMLADADKITDKREREEKKAHIKYAQLLGIEKRPDIYLLGVLNMILMGDGTSNILQADSLKEFDGNYSQGPLKGQKFPASVFLLNPPYSTPGKGLVFAEKAMNAMIEDANGNRRQNYKGKAAVLIQENAGSGNGLPFAKRILENHSLVASIHMADIFCGKAGVQTCIYVFDVGMPHNPKKNVTFIDMSEDGYARQNRKKASSDTNLKNVDHAIERYQEVVDIVLGNKTDTNYYKDCTIMEPISLEGNDWTYNQHKKIDTVPTLEDFKKTVADYLSWKVSALMKGEISLEAEVS